MFILRRLLLVFFSFSYKGFLKSLDNPRGAQGKTLKSILKNIPELSEIRDYDEFQKRVPITSYDDSAFKIFDTKDKIVFHETTSGSSGAKKKIPYTNRLIKSFSKMFVIWAYDLLRYGPDLKTLKLYFSVSPQFSDQEQRLDTEYVEGFLGKVINFFSIVPNSIKSVSDPNEFRKRIAKYMIEAKSLEIISVWSPSFLNEIVDEIKDQTLCPLEETFNDLKLISCWGSANSSYHLERLKDNFPNTLIQKKGLLATEAPVTVPLMMAEAPCPLITEVFLEFEDENQRILLLHEIEVGKTYEIILTQSSGLLRYRIGDRVRVKGKVKNTPVFDFIGRAKDVSDLVGEKLNENFVEKIWSNHFKDQLMSLVPCLGDKSHYVVLSNKEIDCDELDSYFMENPHYKNARKLGQLAPVQSLVSPDMQNLINDYFSHKGISIGDQKNRALYIHESQGKMIEFISKKM